MPKLDYPIIVPETINGVLTVSADQVRAVRLVAEVNSRIKAEAIRKLFVQQEKRTARASSDEFQLKLLRA